MPPSPRIRPPSAAKQGARAAAAQRLPLPLPTPILPSIFICLCPTLPHFAQQFPPLPLAPSLALLPPEIPRARPHAVLPSRAYPIAWRRNVTIVKNKPYRAVLNKKWAEKSRWRGEVGVELTTNDCCTFVASRLLSISKKKKMVRLILSSYCVLRELHVLVMKFQI